MRLDGDKEGLALSISEDLPTTVLLSIATPLFPVDSDFVSQLLLSYSTLQEFGWYWWVR